MQITCPACRTGFLVDPAALGMGGRKVRCTRCRNVWTATAADAVAEMTPAMPAASEHAGAAAPVAAMSVPEVVAWQESETTDIGASPPLVPDGAATSEITLSGLTRDPSAHTWTPPKRKNQAKKGPAHSRLFAISVLMVSALIVAIGSRESVVRAVPDLAGAYALIGLPVNLRGLEFHGVKTTHESQDGIPVLVIEGEVANVSPQPVELPRLRFAVLGTGGNELYSWTAVLPRSALSEGERIPFRSRLASPPAESREVMVRFLNRGDLTAGSR